MYVCMCVCMYEYVLREGAVSVCMHVFMCSCAWGDTHTHTHINTHKSSLCLDSCAFWHIWLGPHYQITLFHVLIGGGWLGNLFCFASSSPSCLKDKMHVCICMRGKANYHVYVCIHMPRACLAACLTTKCVHVYACVKRQINMSMCVFTCLERLFGCLPGNKRSVCIRVHIRICMCIYTHAYTYMYVMYTHAWTCPT